MLMVSVSFASAVPAESVSYGNYPSVIFIDYGSRKDYYTNPTTSNSESTNMGGCQSSLPSQGTIVSTSTSNGFNRTFFVKCEVKPLSPTDSYPVGHNIYLTVKYTYFGNSEPTPTCTADQILDTATNTCKPKCNETGTYDANTGYCLDKSPIVSVQTTQNGSTVIKYADGGIMILFDGLGTTFDKDGNLVANRYYGGVIPPTASWDDLSFASSSNVAYNSLSLNGQPFLSFNAIGDALKVVATGLAFPASSWMLLLSDTKQQKNGDVVNFTPTSSNAVNVDLTTVNFDNIDFSEYAPSSGAVASVPNTDLSAQKIVDETTLKTINQSLANQAKIGDTIVKSASNPNITYIENSSQIKVVDTSSSDKASVLEINKADLANTANNNTDLTYNVKEVTKTINNDGTVTQKETTTPSTLSPKTNNNMSTNPITGETQTQNAANASGVANMSDGKSIDLSGIKGSIDQLGKQLEKANGLLEAGNGILNGIKGDTGSMKGSLNGIQGSLNGIQGLMSQSSDGLSESEWSNGIPTDYSVFETWKGSWDNFKGDLDRVYTRGEEIKELVNGGSLVLNLPKGSVQQCPYNGSIDLVFTIVPLSFDFCTVLSPLRPVFYTMFYFFFVFTILFASLKTLMRMA